MSPEGTASEVPVLRWRAGQGTKDRDRVADEHPVCITFNRTPHVVLMATPSDLEDLAVGFASSEGLLANLDELHAVRVIPREDGLEVALTVDAACQERLETQRRNLAGRTGCGLCGVETLAGAARAARPLGDELRITHEALQRATQQLADRQAQQARTGAVHWAAWCSVSGELETSREDVGRHNALDKLVGHRLRTAQHEQHGFVIVSSRASYEMVYKAAALGSELLAAASAPTGLAIDHARRCGMTLVGFARPGRHNVYHRPDRLLPTPETP